MQQKLSATKFMLEVCKYMYTFPNRVADLWNKPNKTAMVNSLPAKTFAVGVQTFLVDLLQFTQSGLRDRSHARNVFFFVF